VSGLADGNATKRPLARHGTYLGYTSDGCRCDDCRAAWREQHRLYMHNSGRSRPLLEENAARRAAAEARDNHGTETRWQLGCRCDECKAAANAARAARRRHAAPAVHGTHTSYANGCRCDACREATNAYRRLYRARKKASAECR